MVVNQAYEADGPLSIDSAVDCAKICLDNSSVNCLKVLVSRISDLEVHSNLIKYGIFKGTVACLKVLMTVPHQI